MRSSVATAAAAGTAAGARKAPEKGFHPASEAGRGVKIACSTTAVRRNGMSLDQALAAVAAAGYTWVEVGGDELWDYNERPDDFKKLLDQHGLGLVTACIGGDFADREQRLKNISRAVLTARALQALGAGVLVIEGTWGNSPREPFNFHTYSSNLGEVGALVYEETGLHCGYRFREQEAADVRKIIATSDSRYVKFCFDTRYLRELGIAPAPMIQTYQGRVVHVHLREGEKGKTDLQSTLAALCDTHYDGWVTVQQDAAKTLPRVEKQLQAAVAKARPDVAENTQPPEHQHGTVSARQGLVMIGAATLQPAAFFAPAPAPQDKSNPMQQTTHDMHSHRNRPVAPLPPQDPNFQPFFFSAAEYKDVSALADVIVPKTETPGALDARADEYTDLMIWLEQESHKSVRDQMQHFRDLCAKRYGKPYAALTADQRIEFVKVLNDKSLPAADRPALSFFGRIRGLVVKAYYASPQGLLEDLGYKGNTYVAEFKGCTHPEHQG
jgi:sugar phosphate isomerase/epimerase